ncbi:hypothetical protein PsalMR5_04538 (plasmid) [Piscirickettsia salmonis]|nr:hypothetical protein PsalSR1_04476 [Piscirickettsia salmonis]QGP61779.1 hypothetical protein PsalBI1_04421 [Piscirickettsia salmonis]QGP66613.1 hypothetical protein PsalMR5_04538 [Piscirickettsia salmonis]
MAHVFLTNIDNIHNGTVAKNYSELQKGYFLEIQEFQKNDPGGNV